ncbi:ABC transporter permease [Jatrophihabitans sp.]|uniref:ABC transporter permease n=1 Tax=Jatrophihabitans sp. TaxID=1932789 RepID=UPI0030C66171|nr:livH 4 [Jatrophihabitans sp.]
MNEFLAYTFVGLLYGSAYSIAASGLVLTYTTTRVFNLGQGAISMVMAYTYWQLRVADHLPTWLAIALILLIIAPLLGVLIGRVAARNLGDAPVSVSLVVTIGLFVLLIGIAQQIWPADVGRSVPQFFGSDAFTIGTFRLSYHNALTIVLAAVIAAGLYVLLNRTRTGTSMRAAVDNRELLSLFGGAPGRVSTLSWALGSSLSALAGILLVSQVGLDYYQLTFLVIDAFAAAVIGRLQSLPMTFVGAIVVGLGQGYAGYLPQWQVLSGFRDALPTIVLFIALIFLPPVRLRVGQIKGIRSAPVPTRFRTAQVGIAAVVLVALLAGQFSPTHQLELGQGLGYGLVMLSLVLVSGYGGFVSMASLAFMGIGAAVVCKFATHDPLIIVLAVVVCAAAGALVALPVLRLTGLYLALATFAFAELMDKLVFQTNALFGYGSVLNAKRPHVFGYKFESYGPFVTLMAVILVLVAAGLLALRRGAVGRILIAMRDSQIATSTLGLNQRWFRVGLFSLAAAIAGLGGALFAELAGNASATEFQSLYGLEVLLLAVIFGVTSMTGAVLAGMAYMYLPIFTSQHPSLGGVTFLVIGGGAVLLGRDPNGLTNYMFSGVRWLLGRLPVLERITHRPERVVLRQESEQVVSHGAA